LCQFRSRLIVEQQLHSLLSNTVRRLFVERVLFRLPFLVSGRPCGSWSLQAPIHSAACIASTATTLHEVFQADTEIERDVLEVGSQGFYVEAPGSRVRLRHQIPENQSNANCLDNLIRLLNASENEAGNYACLLNSRI